MLSLIKPASAPWGLPCGIRALLGMGLLLVVMQCGWLYMYALEKQAHHAQETQARLVQAAEGMAADVLLWLASGADAVGSVELASAPPHGIVQSRGLVIPPALWFFPPVRGAEAARAAEPSYPTLTAPTGQTGQTILSPPAVLTTDKGESVEVLLTARPRPANSVEHRAGSVELRALPMAALRHGLASRQGPCARGVVRVPTHAGPVLLYIAPPSAALRQRMEQAGSAAREAGMAWAQSSLTVTALGDMTSLGNVSFGDNAFSLGDVSVQAGFESLCPSPTNTQIFATLPPWFWAGQGLAVVMTLFLAVLLWRKGRALSLSSAHNEEGDAPATADGTATALAQQVRAERARRQQLSAQLITLLEGVRCSIARELHDHTGQRLTAVLLALESAQPASTQSLLQPAAQSGPTQNPPQSSSLLLEHTARELRGIHEELRDIARGLRPPALDMLGLEAALRALCSECVVPGPMRPAGQDEGSEQDSGQAVWQNLGQDGAQTARPGLEVRFFADSVPPLYGDKGLALYRVAQEALHNAVKHAHATQVFVSLTGRGKVLALTVEDNGRGFAADGTAAAPAPSTALADAAFASPPPGVQGGLGLLLMAERMAQWGGTLHVESTPGRGTVIMAELPID